MNAARRSRACAEIDQELQHNYMKYYHGGFHLGDLTCAPAPKSDQRCSKHHEGPDSERRPGYGCLGLRVKQELANVPPIA